MNTPCRIIALAILLCLPLPVGATERSLTLDPQATDVSFTLEATGEDVHGTLFLTSADIDFDLDAGTASGRVEIDATRTDTGNQKRDKKMHAKVLESDSNPLILFTPNRVEGDIQGGDITLIGTVTLLGVEHPLTIPAGVTADGEHLSFESHFVIPYVEWGLHDPSWLVFKVAKEVGVSIVAEGTVSTAPPTSTVSGSH